MTDQTSQPPPKKPPTTSMGYGPGGGGAVGIPAKIYTYLEQLVGEPMHAMFPAFDAQSAHAPLIAGYYRPNPVSAAEAEELFWQNTPKFLPPDEGRIYKMLAANINHVAKKKLDPKITDLFRLKDIHDCCDKMRMLVGPATIPAINKLEEIATRQWPIKNHLDKAYDIWAKSLQAPELKDFVSIVLLHIKARSGKMSRLRRNFSRVALSVGRVVNKKWANNYLNDPSVQVSKYTQLFGDARMSDLRGTVFFGAHDVISNKYFNFFCRKKNLLNPRSSENKAVSKNNHKVRDALMSTSAHSLAFPPHRTEDGMLCIDSSPWHAFDRNVRQVMRDLAEENPHARLELFIFNTGNDVIEPVSIDEAHEYLINDGVPGGFSDGKQLAMIGANTLSGGIASLKEELGETAILEITPRLFPRTPKESAEFPSRNPLDTSPSTMQARQKRAQEVLIENNAEIRQMALRIADNLYSIDYWDEATYLARRESILNAEIPKLDDIPVVDAPDIFNEIGDQHEKRVSWRLGNWVSMMFMAASTHLTAGLLPIKPVNDNREVGNNRVLQLQRKDERITQNDPKL